MVHNPLRQVGEAVKKKIENRRTRVRARAALSVTGRAARFAVLFTFCACRAVCQKAVPLCRAIREKIVSSPYAARALLLCRAGVAGSSFSPSHLARHALRFLRPHPPLSRTPPRRRKSGVEKTRGGVWYSTWKTPHQKRTLRRRKICCISWWTCPHWFL